MKASGLVAKQLSACEPPSDGRREHGPAQIRPASVAIFGAKLSRLFEGPVGRLSLLTITLPRDVMVGCGCGW